MPKPDIYDLRITPARADLAASSLRGTVKATHYADAQDMQVCVSLAPLYGAPDATTMLQTELLLGERFDVYEQKNDWVWGQARRDGYVGYMPTNKLGALANAPDHRISALRTPVFATPDLKAPILGYVHENSIFMCAGKEGRYLKLAPDNGWVFAKHAAPLDAIVADWVSHAQAYLGAPYVWGGRSSFGLDCSALVQNALQAGGIAAPRDSDMQEKALGKAVTIQGDLSGLFRGDLVFWKGHVGIMLDGKMFLHANAHHMKVVHEPLSEAVARIKKTTGAITAIRRL